MAARYSIISYSFRRTFERGEMDIFSYIDFCHDKGFTQLDPWMAHLEPGLQDRTWLGEVRSAAEGAGLPFGCVAVDGGHIYEPTAEERTKTRRTREAWLEAAHELGARMVRIDAGGPEEMPPEVFDIIRAGYRELLPQAAALGLAVVVENHWGPTKHPDNVVKLLEAVEGLGLLFDTNNWAEGEAERGWELCARYASLTHIKTHSFDAAGNDPSVDLSKAIRLLRASGYDGAWGIESNPNDGDEIGAALKTLALIKRELARDV